MKNRHVPRKKRGLTLKKKKEKEKQLPDLRRQEKKWAKNKEKNTKNILESEDTGDLALLCPFHHSCSHW